MAKIDRYNGNLEAFSSGALAQERVLFGDDSVSPTESDDLTANINSDFLRGWATLPLGEKPPREWFNSVAFVPTQLSAYLHQMGVAEWNDEQEYHESSFCSGSGSLFMSISVNNVGNDLDDSSNWAVYGVLHVNSKSELESLSAENSGQIAKVTTLGNQSFILQDSGYTAGIGDITCANGRVFKLDADRFVSVRSLGATGDGITNDTIALQNAHDLAYELGIGVEYTEGTYLASGIKYYNEQNVVFRPGAILKNNGVNDFVLRSQYSPSVADPGSGPIVSSCKIDRPVIDMNNAGSCGILLESSEYSKIIEPEFLNAPADGTFSYEDGFGVANYPVSLIIVKGINGRYGCYYNDIVKPVHKGNSQRCVGVWLGTTNGQANQRANNNRVLFPVMIYNIEGVVVQLGGDNYILSPECSLCENGIRIGASTGSDSRRNIVVLPYAENCTNSVKFDIASKSNSVQGVGSVGGSSNVVLDLGQYNSVYNTEYDTEYLRFYFNTLKGLELAELTDSSGNIVAEISASSGFTRLTSSDNDEGVELLDGAQGASSNSLRPTQTNIQRLGTSTREWSQTHSRQIFSNGIKVLDEQQPAISDSSGGDEQAKINSILTALRNHGIIDT